MKLDYHLSLCYPTDMNVAAKEMHNLLWLMLASGCRAGEEFTWAWDTLRREAMESVQYLDRELQGPFVPEVEGAGEGRTDGSTRRLLTTGIEDL